MDDGQREELIRTCIKQMIAKGVKLGIQSWGLDWNKTKKTWAPKKSGGCCGLSCVLLANQAKLHPNVGNWKEYAIETLLETNDKWVNAFVRGWDKYPKSPHDNVEFAYELGMLLREEMVVKDALF